VQGIHGEGMVRMEREDLSGMSGAERERVLGEHRREEANWRFDLRRGPLLRVKLVRLGEEEHLLLLTMHHVVFDGWSTAILVREFVSLYEGYAAGKGAVLPELGVQYADYAVWQRRRMEGG